jgi:DNA-binding GntR family transcriptional regulator
MIPLGGVVQKPATKETSLPARRLRREGRAAPLATEATHLHSLAHKAYEGLLRILFSGELRPNDVIMERRIAEQLGISRTPLREAIRRLEGEKLLQRQSGGAIVVCPMSIEDFLNILSLRRLLEGEGARKAAGHMSAQELLSFRERIRAMATTAEPDSLVAQELGRELHLCIARSADNQVLASLIEDMGKRTRLFIRLFVRIADRRVQVCDEHLALIDALLEGNGEHARACMERHIDSIRAFVLDKLAAL